MNKVQNLKELEEVELLLKRDIVVFCFKLENGGKGEMTHRVGQSSSGCFLDNIDSGNNAKLFTELDIDKIEFCTKSYGYPPEADGQWPYAKEHDYKAITRVVRDLYMLIEGVQEEVKEIEEVDRFSLMDLD